jgi:hypothetical protein
MFRNIFDNLLKVRFIIPRHPVLVIGWFFILFILYNIIDLYLLVFLSFLFIIFIYFDDINFKNDLKKLVRDEFEMFLEKEFNSLYWEYHMEHGGDSPLETNFIEFVNQINHRTQEEKCIRSFQILYRKLLDHIAAFPDSVQVEKVDN